MDVLSAIRTRRSVRKFEDKPVEREQLMDIIRAGTWAPSGLNNQPWRFVIVQDRDLRLRLAALTKYRGIIAGAPTCIAVFVDREAMYSEVKDYQAMGACIENMLLATHALGLGAVWLGEILKNAGEVRALFHLPETLELMAVVAVGHPAAGHKRTSERRDLREVLLKEL